MAVAGIVGHSLRIGFLLKVDTQEQGVYIVRTQGRKKHPSEWVCSRPGKSWTGGQKWSWSQRSNVRYKVEQNRNGSVA